MRELEGRALSEDDAMAAMRIMDAFMFMGPVKAKATLCACVDLVAKMNGQTSLELVDEIRPMIEEVDRKMGAF